MIPLESITKHVLRVTIYDFDSKKFVANSTFVLAKFNPKHKDQWRFNKSSETGTNPLIFRTDELYFIDRQVFIIFEFVIYCQQDEYT